MSKWLFISVLCLFFFLSASAVSTDARDLEHPSFILIDYEGNKVSLEANTPYSPKNTCGGCHDYEAITNAYHFQQGRTNADGEIIVSDDLDPKSPWLISHGMYGKW